MHVYCQSNENEEEDSIFLGGGILEKKKKKKSSDEPPCRGVSKHEALQCSSSNTVSLYLELHVHLKAYKLKRSALARTSDALCEE